MTLGSLDANGVGRYVETTPIGTKWSDYMNEGLESVSDAIGNLAIADTGWINLTLINGWSSGQLPQYRRKNGVVYLKGRPTGGSSTTIAQLPVGFRPGGSVSIFSAVIDGSSAATIVRVVVQSDGSIVAGATSHSPNISGCTPFPVGA